MAVEAVVLAIHYVDRMNCLVAPLIQTIGVLRAAADISENTSIPCLPYMQTR